MKLKTNLVVLFITIVVSNSLGLAIESDNAKFLAKEKENTLRMLNFSENINKKLQVQQEKEASKDGWQLREEGYYLDEDGKFRDKDGKYLTLEEIRALERKRKEAEELKLREEKVKVKKEEEERKLREREEQRRKLEEERRRQEEIRRNRKAKVKVVNLTEKGKVNLQNIKVKKEEFYMEDYRELGEIEDISSSAVNRAKIVTSDMYIRLITQTNINSRRGGEFVAMVERDVFSLDSEEVYSKNILVPKGSKFICSFEPLKAYGETALKSECKEVIFPDGRKIIFSGNSLTDQMGRSGITGKLDNRVWEKYGQTFVMAILSGGAMMGADMLPNSGVASLGQYTALSILDLSTKLLEKTIDLAPVVIIPSGARIVFRPTMSINLEVKTEEEIYEGGE